MSDKNKEKDRSILLVALLFIGAAALFFLSQSPSPRKGTVTDSPTKNHNFEKSVNKHLMITNDKIEMAKQKMALENAALARELYETSPQKSAVQQELGVDLSTDTRAYDIAAEIGRGHREEPQPSTPDEVIQRELFNAQQSAEYTRAYKEEYARQFVENARKGGYAVQLDENFKVKSVVPIRKPSQSVELFGASSNGEPLR